MCVISQCVSLSLRRANQQHSRAVLLGLDPSHSVICGRATALVPVMLTSLPGFVFASVQGKPYPISALYLDLKQLSACHVEQIARVCPCVCTGQALPHQCVVPSGLEAIQSACSGRSVEVSVSINYSYNVLSVKCFS